MDDDLTLLGIIPARSGSKGVPDKNIREVGGKPLIAHTIEDAIGSNLLDEFLVSTDSERYAEIARNAGAPVPFIRPAELATDNAPTVDVVKHAINEFESRHEQMVDAIVLLQPTAPLRTAEDIDAAIELFLRSDVESLITCYETVDAHPNYMYERASKNRVVAVRDQKNVPDRRQDFDPVYLRNGAVYVSTREIIFNDDRVYGERPAAYVMPQDRSVNIDEEFDLKLAQLLIEEDD
jgi:CMP-N-acetylneuraminic acid synthetase